MNKLKEPAYGNEDCAGAKVLDTLKDAIKLIEAGSINASRMVMIIEDDVHDGVHIISADVTGDEALQMLARTVRSILSGELDSAVGRVH